MQIAYDMAACIMLRSVSGSVLHCIMGILNVDNGCTVKLSAVPATPLIYTVTCSELQCASRS